MGCVLFNIQYKISAGEPLPAGKDLFELVRLCQTANLFRPLALLLLIIFLPLLVRILARKPSLLFLLLLCGRNVV
jgi:hypothetical protein